MGEKQGGRETIREREGEIGRERMMNGGTERMRERVRNEGGR